MGRTSGPFFPSGRRLASISSGGSGVGRPSSRDIRSATACGVGAGHLIVLAGQRLHDEHHVGVGGVAQFGTAEPAHPDDGEPGPEAAPLGGHLLDGGVVGGRAC